MSSGVLLIFHAAVAAMYFMALAAFQELPRLPHIKNDFAGRWKYLTYWNLIVHFLYFAFAVGFDLVRPSHKAIKIRDTIYAGIVLPYGLFVPTVFWGLYGINRELIFPKVCDAIFPLWLNHVGHTAMLPVLLVETYAVRHRHPQRKDGIALNLVFGFIYMFWVLYLGMVQGSWAYPILDILNWNLRCILLGGGAVLGLIMYLVGEKLNSYCWGNNIVSKNK